MTLIVEVALNYKAGVLVKVQMFLFPFFIEEVTYSLPDIRSIYITLFVWIKLASFRSNQRADVNDNGIGHYKYSPNGAIDNVMFSNVIIRQHDQQI